jgi:hypothetical protein
MVRLTPSMLLVEEASRPKPSQALAIPGPVDDPNRAWV